MSFKLKNYTDEKLQVIINHLNGAIDDGFKHITFKELGMGFINATHEERIRFHLAEDALSGIEDALEAIKSLQKMLKKTTLQKDKQN